MENNTTQTLMSFNEKMAEQDKQDELKRWDYWFDLTLWDYREAIRLICCGPRGCIEQCIKDVENPSDGYRENLKCFYEYNDPHINNVKKCLNIFERDKLPPRITPDSFIQWARTKKTISLPEEMNKRFLNKPLKNQGGSNKEHDKIKATKEVCRNIASDIISSQDYNNKITENDFIDKVATSMKANDKGHLFQKTAASDFFHDSTELALYKRKRGRPKIS